jgi:peptidoglycan/xylan/chitin deacetylase (PgdA/CDA1 family)
MYHSISDVTSKVFAPFVIPPHEFAAQIEYLASHGYTTLTLADLVRIRLSGSRLPPRPVVLTFDDAYADFGETVAPLLLRHQFTASLYVTTGAVGRTNFWVKGDVPRRILTWDELREIAATRVEIGAHSITHRAMDALAAPDLHAELADPKAQLEDRLNQDVPTLAYPFGFESGRVRAAAAAAGYLAACAVGYQMSADGEDRFALSRLIVLPGMDLAAYGRLLDGRGPQWVQRARRVRSLAWRVVRRAAQVRTRGASAPLDTSLDKGD